MAGNREWSVTNGTFSSWIYILSGVPRASILGPLLLVKTNCERLLHVTF